MHMYEQYEERIPLDAKYVVTFTETLGDWEDWAYVNTLGEARAILFFEPHDMLGLGYGWERYEGQEPITTVTVWDMRVALGCLLGMASKLDPIEIVQKVDATHFRTFKGSHADLRGVLVGAK